MPRSPFANGIIQIADIALGMLAISLSISLLANAITHWLTDIFTHFQLQYAIGSLILYLFFTLFKEWKRCLLCLGLCLFSSSYIALSYSFKAPSESEAVFSVASYNRNYAPTHHDEVLAFLKQEKPDIVVLQEANASLSQAVESVRDLYPHQIHEPREHAFGMVVLSKHPFTKKRVKHFDRIVWDNFQINIEVEILGQAINIFAIHPPPPMNAGLYKQRNIELSLTATDAYHSQSRNVIMLGDWNVSPFSPHFRAVLKKTGLRNEQTLPYIFPTWPAQFVVPIIQIPIDHILHRGNLELVEKKRFPAIGSDHYPVVARYAFSSQNNITSNF